MAEKRAQPLPKQLTLWTVFTNKEILYFLYIHFVFFFLFQHILKRLLSTVKIRYFKYTNIMQPDVMDNRY